MAERVVEPAVLIQPGDLVAEAAVREQVSRMLASPDFLLPERARQFFLYIVEEALCGRGDRIKAFSIATDVLGRDSSFDGSPDPVVRIEAGRVRRALEHYYLTGGVKDPVVITDPQGWLCAVLHPTAGGRHGCGACRGHRSLRGVSLTVGGGLGSAGPRRPCSWRWSRRSA